MLSNRPFRRFGKPDCFALEYRLLPDPDGDAAAPAESVGSWGQWRLWVHGLNLTEHRLTLATGAVSRQDCVTWYLAPLLRWLAMAWTPLLHEERLPGVVRRALDGRSAYLAIASTRMDETEVFGPWQAWASRHSLRWAAEGGLVPDLFLRRLGDDIEISWGERQQPGGEAAEYVIEPGVAHVAAVDAAAALNEALMDAVSVQEWRGYEWHRHFRRRVAARPEPRKTKTALAWFLDGKPRPARLSKLFEEAVQKGGKRARFLLDGAVTAHAITQLSPAAAMFGSLSPNISEDSAIRLLAIAAGSRASGQERIPLEDHVEARPAWMAEMPWEDGYSLALDFRDALDMTETTEPVDLDGLLQRLNVGCHDESLGADGPLGVALAGPGIQPTIVVNTSHPNNGHGHGRRFTLAHELCHLLHDRDHARRIAHSSTQWAPLAVEQRANAFAAMLLMPPDAVKHAFHPRSRRPTLAEIAAMARTLQVGLRAAIQHLANLGTITEEDRDRLLDEAAEVALPRPAPRARK